jgi:hypothetical protein
MSRPYRIVVQRVVEREVNAEDRTVLRLKLDPILPEERLDEVLGAVLEKNGWERTADGTYQQSRGDGETLTCDVKAREVSCEIAVETTVREVVRKELRGDTWNWRQMREMTDEELAELEQAEAERLESCISETDLAKRAEEIREEVSQRLAEGDAERRETINKLVIEVTAEALKEKASELGTVKSLDERWDGQDYELTIQISE